MHSLLHALRRRDPRVDRLRHVAPFTACSEDELAAVVRRTAEHRFEPGEVLIREGTVGHEVFVILEGAATVHIGGRLVARLGPGEFVGELALLDRRSRTATVVAETPLVVTVSGIGEFADLLTEAPHLTRKLLAGLATRLRAADRAPAAAPV
jgi:CRP-like cAMP-binding protein